MVGTRGQGSKSKSKVQALVLDEPEPEPLKAITAEAADEPFVGEEENDQILNSEVVPAMDEGKQMMSELNDEKEDTGIEVECTFVGNEPALTDLDEKDQLEGKNDCKEAAINMDVENGNQKTNGDEPNEDTSNAGDAVFNAEVENDTKKINGEELEGCEYMHTEEVEKGPDVSSDVTIVNEGLVASDQVGVENMTERTGNDKEADELRTAKNVDECPANEIEVVTEKVNRSNKKIVRKKFIKDKISSSAEELANSPSKNGDTSITEDATPAAEEKVVEPKKKIVRGKLIKKKVSPIAEEPASSLPENGDESIKEDATEVKADAETVSQPKRKIVRKKLIRNKILPSNDVTDINEANPQPLNGNEGSDGLSKAETSNEATDDMGKLDNTENVNNDEVEVKPLVKVNKKRMLIRKKKPQNQSDAQTDLAEQTPKPENDEPSKENEIIEEEKMNEEAEGPKGRRRKRKNKKVVPEGTPNVNEKDIDKPGSSKKMESMGMIFMCSSETKRDCFRHKVFGLPASKKDIVTQIYKGMRLFLFDVDLKMLYGIYKAAGPGRLNIEPRAFKSKFPSQVRFTILEDCLPLAEEKFKKVIKDNYYTKNKFDCKLTSEQVRNLGKLFHETTKRSESKRVVQIQRPNPPARVDKKRKWVEDGRRVGPVIITTRFQERRRKSPELSRHAHVARPQHEMGRAITLRSQHEMGRAITLRSQHEMGRAITLRNQHEMGHAITLRDQHEMGRALIVRAREETRRAPVIVDDRYRQPMVVYERESYQPPLVSSSSLYQTLREEDPPRNRIYASYERDPPIDPYRRDSVIEYQSLPVNPAPRERHLDDSYGAYREPQVRLAAYESGARLAGYETSSRREHYDYLVPGTTMERYSDYYRSEDGRPPLPLHRRY